jgi:hypothetical protein
MKAVFGMIIKWLEIFPTFEKSLKKVSKDHYLYLTKREYALIYCEPELLSLL